MTWRTNTGTMPEDARGKRIDVVLFNGKEYHDWPADGSKGMVTNWAISKRPHPFQIEKFKVR